ARAAPIGPGAMAPGTWGPHTSREARHQSWKETFVGRPADFVEPPLGYYLRENFGLMRAKADPHRFTLYRSDFLDGSDRLSPTGASRFNIMTRRLRSWPGPGVIEGSPESPGLAEARRAAGPARAQTRGAPAIPQRGVIPPSPDP